MRRFSAILTSSILMFAVGGPRAWAGGVDTWGNNTDGELGDGNPGFLNFRSAPFPVPSLSNGVTALAAGGDHSLAVQNGAVYVWGRNGNGQLGDGNTGDANSRSVPFGLTGALSSSVVAVAAGGDHSLALTGGGGVYAWGYNYYGQVGSGGNTDQSSPVALSGALSSGVTAIAAGNNFSLAVSGGQVYAWGRNDRNQLGNGNTTDQWSPVAVGTSTLTAVTAVAAGAFHCLALQNNAVYSWGYNFEGELGIGSTVNSSSPVALSGALSSGVTSIAAGYGHSLAVKNGAVYAWGDNAFGQLGNGVTDFGSTTPVLVPGLGNAVITQVAAGAESSYALANDGSLWVWGDNSWGQLGLGDDVNMDYLSPARFSAPAGFAFTSIDSDAGGNHVVALTVPTIISAGTVQLSGNNMYPTAVDLTVNGGTLDLHGFNQQLNSLSDGGVHTGVVTNSSPTAAVLMLSPAGQATRATFGGVLGGNLGLAIAGAGTTTLTGADNYGGPTIVSAGLLDFGGGVTHAIGAVTLGGNLMVEGGTTVVSKGLNGTSSASVWTIAGTYQLAQGSQAAGTTKVYAVPTFTGTGTLDLTDNKLIVESTGGTGNKSTLISSLNTLVAQGSNGGTWTGNGITSSTAAADHVAGSPKTTIAVVDNGAYAVSAQKSTFGGTAVDPSSILVTRALVGDINLDNSVNLLDYSTLITHYGLPSGQTWATGDLNGDGAVNLLDYSALITNYGQNLVGGFSLQPADTFISTPAGGGSSTQAVPEPASLVILALAAVGLLTRRRRKWSVAGAAGHWVRFRTKF